jgi:hypothetical protein
MPGHPGPQRIGAWDDTPAIGSSGGTPPVPATREPENDGAYDLGPWDTAPDDRSTEPQGLYQQPLYLADVHAPPGDRTGRHARADTPPPLPGQRPPELGLDGRPIRIGAAEVPGPAKITPPDRRLPVPIEKEKPEPRGSWQPLVLVAALITGIAVAAAVVVMTLPKAAGQENPPAAQPSAATSVAAAPKTSAGAPADVRLRDNRDSVSLDWDYPKGSEGPVLISGGRVGAETRAFQTLPAGSTNYVVYGLNEGLDYCFTVAVAYSTDRVVTSSPLCTHRH